MELYKKAQHVVFAVLKTTLYMWILGRCAKTEMMSMQKNVVMMHGARPYIMAIAIMYVSPIVIVALKEGKKRKNGTVAIAKSANISHWALYELVAKSHPAHKTMGNARHATDTTYTLTLNGKSPQVITR
jgi:hypothetical protein